MGEAPCFVELVTVRVQSQVVVLFLLPKHVMCKQNVFSCFDNFWSWTLVFDTQGRRFPFELLSVLLYSVLSLLSCSTLCFASTPAALHTAHKARSETAERRWRSSTYSVTCLTRHHSNKERMEQWAKKSRAPGSADLKHAGGVWLTKGTPPPLQIVSLCKGTSRSRPPFVNVNEW